VIVFITTIVVSLSVSFFCNLMEACLLSISLTDIAKMSEKQPLVASIWKKFRDNIQKPIAVILVINTFAHTIGAALSGAQFSRLFDPKWVALYSVVFSLVMIQWTEIVPKTLGYRYNRVVALTMGIPMKTLIILFTPLLAVIQFLNRPFEGKGKKATSDALGDINVLTRFATLNNLISKEQAKIVNRSINLSKTKVSEVMVNRGEIKYLSSAMTLTDALISAHIHYHTRYLLIEGENIDSILGYVNFKDIVTALRINPVDPSLRGIVRPVLSVFGNESASNILNRMIQGHHHIAVVTDTGGRVSGLVTLEDIIEEVFGEIQDEFDILPSFIRAMPDNRFLIGGATPINQVREKVCTNLPDEATTVDSWLRAHMGKAPQRNDRYQTNGYEFVIQKVRRSQIHECLVACLKKGAQA
jgi:putative hemolysin